MSDHLTTIRFGILCDNDHLAIWEREAIEKLLRTPSISLILLIKINGSITQTDSAKNFSDYSLYNKYVKWIHKPSTLREISIIDLLENTPLLQCTPKEKTNYSYSLNDQDVDYIREAKLDFILSFVKQPINGPVLSACRFGVWIFRYGSQRQYQTVLVGFWELYNKGRITPVSLCQLLDTDNYITIKEGFFRTKLHSHSGLIDNIHQEVVNWPADISRQLLTTNSFANYALNYLSNNTKHPWPSNKQVLRFILRLLKNKLYYLYKILFLADQWNIGVVNRPIKDFIYIENLKGATVDAPHLPNRNVFYADCFAQRTDAGFVIYFEYYDYRTRRGNISTLKYPWQVNDSPTKAIKFPYHLSYPFLFESYCMPEAWITNSVRLYDIRKSVEDPNKGLVLLADVPGIDSTLVKYDNRYWLFYTRADRDPMLNLFISYADCLEGPWQEHLQNPVKSDISSSRPAGPFFKVDNKLYRPAQDCSLNYGCGITLNEVVELTPFSFKEKKVSYLTSLHSDYPDGMHTLTAVDDDHTLIDFKRYRFIPMATLLALWMLVSTYLISKKSASLNHTG